MSERTNIRIVDIAKMAGVSVGTVDRVLHNRGRVSEEKRIKIEQVLKEINYEPNLVARLLASKHNYNLVAIIPSFAEGDYWSSVSEGINRALKELKKFNIKLEYLYFDQARKESFAHISETLKNEDFDGVLIATLFGDHVIELSKILDEKETPYVYIDSNIPSQNSLAYFGADSFISGSIAAKLMMYEIGLHSEIIIAQIINNKEVSTQMQNRELGFRDYLTKNNFEGKIHRIEMKPDDYLDSLVQLRRIVEESDSLVGGIVFNSRIFELAYLLEQIGPDFQKKVKLVGYDSIGKNVEALKNDKISFLIAQHSEAQGYEGIRFLGNYLLFGQTEKNKINLMPIDILMKENIDYYKNYKL